MNNCAKITVMKGNAKDSNTMKKHQYVYVITVITEEKENTMKNVNMAKLNCISNCSKDGCFLIVQRMDVPLNHVIF